jgi:DNA-binding CsgD family transcriptional regulator
VDRASSAVAEPLPGPPDRPDTPDLIRLFGGPRSERAPRLCGCQETRGPRCAGLLSLGLERHVASGHADAQLSDADRCPDPGCVWRSLLTLLFAGDLVLADLHCARLAEQPRWAGTSPSAQVVQVVRARISFLVGDPAETIRILGALVRGPIAESMDAVVVAWLTEALVHMGEPNSAESLLISRGYSGSLAADLPGKALLLYARGQVHLSQRRTNRALKDFLACGREVAACDFANPPVIPWRTGAALCLRQPKQVELARSLARAELAGARKWGSPREIGRASLASAMLADDTGSMALITEAADLLGMANARGDAAWAANAIGEDAGLQRDRPWARQVLRRVVDLTERSGNRYAAEQAGSKLTEFRATHGNPVLTKHEIEVVKLVWVGCNNAEIADRLSLTRRTVEYHLSAVYRKFQLADRRQLYLAMTKFW